MKLAIAGIAQKKYVRGGGGGGGGSSICRNDAFPQEQWEILRVIRKTTKPTPLSVSYDTRTTTTTTTTRMHTNG